MQVNSIQSNQNFGMAIKVDPDAIKILSEKLGTRANLNKFDDFLRQQRHNPFNVHIIKDLYGNNVRGYVADASTYFQEHNKGIFQSTIKWIERMCNDATNQLKKASLNESLKDILSK